MFEISPVLAGTYDKPATLNAAAEATTDIDARRYTQWDRSASKVADADMSFGDFLDMINPLQHIPVVSSVYREITGDKINPVARVAGDTLYGMALGPAGALFGAVGAIADSMMEEKTGKDVTGAVYAGLFGDEKEAAGDEASMVAANTATPQPVTAAPAPTTEATTAVARAAPVTPANDTTTIPADQAAELLASIAPAPTDAAAPAAPPTNTQFAANLKPLTPQGFSLARNNLPYGGAMAPVQKQPANYSKQNMAMGIAQLTGMHIGNSIYPTRLVNGARQLPIAVMVPPTETAPAPDAVAKASDPVNPMTSLPVANATPIPPALADDASILKALGAYQNTAAMGLKPQNPYQSMMGNAAN